MNQTVNVTYGRDGRPVINKRAWLMARRWFAGWMIRAGSTYFLN